MVFIKLFTKAILSMVIMLSTYLNIVNNVTAVKQLYFKFVIKIFFNASKIYQSHLEKNLHKAKKFSLYYSSANIDEAITNCLNIYIKTELNNIASSTYKNFADLCTVNE